MATSAVRSDAMASLNIGQTTLRPRSISQGSYSIVCGLANSYEGLCSSQRISHQVIYLFTQAR